MNVLDGIFRDGCYGAFVATQISPVVGLVGPVDSAIEEQLLQALQSCPYQAGSRLIFTTVPNIDVIPKKKDRTPFDGYQANGIFKRHWAKKHQSTSFGCIVLMFDWDSCTIKDRLAFEQAVYAVVDRARTRVRNTNTRMILALHTNRNPTQPVPPSGSYLSAEDATINLRSRCGLDEKGVVVVHKSDAKTVARLHRNSYELCLRYHRDEAQRIKRYKGDILKTSNSNFMIARHRFKVGWHFEMVQDAKLRKRSYDKAYAALKAVSPAPLEVRLCASIIFIRSTSASSGTSTADWEANIRHFCEHIEWIQEPYPAGAFTTDAEKHTTLTIQQWMLVELYSTFAETILRVHHNGQIPPPRPPPGISGPHVSASKHFGELGMPAYNMAAAAELLRQLRDGRATALQEPGEELPASPTALAPVRTEEGDEDEAKPNGCQAPYFLGQELNIDENVITFSTAVSTIPSREEVSSLGAQMAGKAMHHYREMQLPGRCMGFALQIAEHHIVAEEYETAFSQLSRILQADESNLLQWPGLRERILTMIVFAVQEGKLHSHVPTAVRCLLLAMVHPFNKPYASLGEVLQEERHAVDIKTLSPLRSQRKCQAQFNNRLEMLKAFLAKVHAQHVEAVAFGEVPEERKEGVQQNTGSSDAKGSDALFHSEGEDSPELHARQSQHQHQHPHVVLDEYTTNQGVVDLKIHFERAYGEAQGDPVHYRGRITTRVSGGALSFSDMSLVFRTLPDVNAGSMSRNGSSTASPQVSPMILPRTGDETSYGAAISGKHHLVVPLNTTHIRSGSGGSQHQQQQKGAGELREWTLQLDDPIEFEGQLRPKTAGLLECCELRCTWFGVTLHFPVTTSPHRKRLMELPAKYDHLNDHSVIDWRYFPHRPCILVVHPVARVEMTTNQRGIHAVHGEDYPIDVVIHAVADPIRNGRLLIGCFDEVIELVKDDPLSIGADPNGNAASQHRRAFDSASRVSNLGSPNSAAPAAAAPPTTEDTVFNERVEVVPIPDIALGESQTITLRLRCLRAGKLGLNLKLEFSTDRASVISVHQILQLHVCHPVFVYFTVADTIAWLPRDTSSRAAGGPGGSTRALLPTADGNHQAAAQEDCPPVYLPYEGASAFFVESPEMRNPPIEITSANAPLTSEASFIVVDPSQASALGIDASPPSARSSLGLLGSTSDSGGGGGSYHHRHHHGLSQGPFVQFYTVQQSQLPTESTRSLEALRLRTQQPFIVSCRFVNSLQFPLILQRMYVDGADTNTKVLSSQEPPGLLPCTLGVDEEYSFTVTMQYNAVGENISLGSAVLVLSRSQPLDDEGVDSQKATSKKNPHIEFQLPLPTATFVATPVVVTLEYPPTAKLNTPMFLKVHVKNTSLEVQEVEISSTAEVASPSPSAAAATTPTANMSSTSSTPMSFLIAGRTAWNTVVPPSRTKTTTLKLLPLRAGWDVLLPSFTGRCRGSYEDCVVWPDEQRTVNVLPS